MNRSSERRWVILGVLVLSSLLVTIDNTIVNVALPTMGRELDAGITDLQWVVDAYTLVFAGLLLVGGNLGDRLGRKRILILGLALFAVTSLAGSLAQDTGQLIAARAAMGAAAALVFPATLAILIQVFTVPRERAMAIGIWAATAGVAVALGPVTGGFLLEHYSWGSVFVVGVPIAVIAAVAGWFLVPDSRDPSPGRFDGLGALLSIGSIGLLVYALIEAPRHGWASPATVVGLAAALSALTAFVVWESRRTDPLLEVRLFRNARFSAASAAIALAFFGLFGFIFLVTQYFQVVQGYGTLEAGLRTLPFAVVMGALSPVAVLAVRLLGTKLVVAGGLLLMSAGFAVAATVSSASQYWGAVVVSMVLMAAGLALIASPATEAIMGALPPAKAGAGSAVNDTSREVGGTLGVAVLGSVMVSVYGDQVVGALRSLGLPTGFVEAAQDSVVAGYQGISALPAAVQPAATAAVRDAFLAGLSAASWVAVGATAVAAIGALLFLPARGAGEQSRTAHPAESDVVVGA
ncbi:MAG: DHA2 family efflux MFS transporter permease subunit [Actinomycetota bacterium]|nr:MAG: DHA2 family efflux MFS transporter permease subunit [Actinomycetota bacterium]